MTLAGVALAVAGIMLVLNVWLGPAHRAAPGRHINATGIAWGLAAAICAACYFMMSDEVSADGSGLNSITLAAGGLVVGAIAVGLLGLTGVMPLTFTTSNAVVAGLIVPWWFRCSCSAVVATAIAYTLGISGVARLRPSFASLVGLGEVLFAVLSAWVLLGEAVTCHAGRRRRGGPARPGPGPPGRSQRRGHGTRRGRTPDRSRRPLPPHRPSAPR